jgi:hypothetical protein
VTELETAIIIAGTLMSALVGYFLGERREANKFRREIAVKPLPYQQEALREACYALMDFVTRYDGKRTSATIALSDRLNDALSKAFLWCSEGTRGKLTEFVRKWAALSGENPLAGSVQPQKERDEFYQGFSSAYQAMAEELGVTVLRSQLEDIARGLGQERQKE